MQPHEFLSTGLAGGSDQLEEWLINEVVIGGSDQQSDGGECCGDCVAAATVSLADPCIQQRCGHVESEAAPAAEVVEWEADGRELVADG